MDEKTLALVGAALFEAQNTLTGYWQEMNREGGDEAQKQIEYTQERLREAVRALGGVDRLLDAGA